MTPPKGFCASLPYQPRIWDPSFLAVASTCWRKHWLQTVRGLRRNGVTSVHFVWGKAYHASTEHYDKLILDGRELQEAQAQAMAFVRHIAAGSADAPNLWGETVKTWRCTDPELVPAKRLRVWRHIETGSTPEGYVPSQDELDEWEAVPKMIANRDRCRFAKGPQPVPEDVYVLAECPNCARGIETGSIFVPYDPKKTGETLIAAVKAYCEQSTSVKPYRFPDLKCEKCQGIGFINPYQETLAICIDCDGKGTRPGIAALELQARLPLSIESPDRKDCVWCEGQGAYYPDECNIEQKCSQCDGRGTEGAEPYELLVNLDCLVEWEDEVAIRERKTTGMHIESPKVARQYWAQFNPNIQIDTYDLVGSVLYTSEIGRSPKIMVEALNISDPKEPKIERRVIHISESRRDEWFRELQDLIKEAEVRAVKAMAAEFCVSRDLDPAQAFPRRTTSCVQGFRTCAFLDVCTAAPADREAIIEANYHVERWVPEDAESFIEEE